MKPLSELFDLNGNFERNIKLDENNNFQTPLSIAWRNLSYEIPEYTQFPPKKKPILQKLNGFFEQHTLNAFLGPSGAGKTTLLNCLSGAVTSGLTSDSTIYISDHTPVSFFIEQQVHNVIEPKLTVGQILSYAFQFKNGINKAALDSMQQHITDTIKELLFTKDILNRQFEKCSGGEQKRIAICQELMALTKPNFLFIDEPTTGLDSFAALKVIKCLAQLAKNHRMTIITSIHVPSEELLCYFNKLYVLAKGGVAIFAGSPELLKFHLEDQINTAVFEEERPIEVAIKLACDGISNPQVQKLALQIATTESQVISSHLSTLTHLPTGLPNQRKPFSTIDLFLCTSRLFKTTFIAQYRQFGTQILLFIGITLAISSFFNPKMVHPNGCQQLNSNYSAQCDYDFFNNLLLNENINYILFNRLLQTYIVICSSTLMYSGIVKVFANEHRNRWYSLGVFYCATCLISIIQVTIFSITFAIVAYFAASEHAIDAYQINWHRIAHYTFCIWITLLLVQSIGQFFGAIILERIEIAMLSTTVCFTFFIMHDDFFFKTEEMKLKILTHVANVLGINYATRYLIYIFYGLDRCNLETESSWVLTKNYVDSTQIEFYAMRILTNACILRVATFILMYFKFNSFKNWSFVKSKKPANYLEMSTLFEVNYSTSIDIQANQLETISQTKESNELQFQQFSRHKICIAWRNLTLFGTKSIFKIRSFTGSEQESILKNLNGQFRFGTLNALMGMSGSGKTSLLKVLDGCCSTRLSSKTDVYLSKFTLITTTFISQEVSGHLLRGLTAKQLLVYASRLKNQQIRGKQITHEEIALKILKELNLSDIINTKVEKCSGGEMKRLALALELTPLQMPNLICIDEPTSGLDSNSAKTVISTLHNLAQNHPITIVASIHQPNTELLRMFDQLYVLARGGVCVYSGPPNGIQNHLMSVSTLTNDSSIETLIKLSSLGHKNEIVQQLSKTNNETQTKVKLQADTQLVLDGVTPNRVRFSFKSIYILSLRYCAYIQGYLWKEWLAFMVLHILYAFAMTIFFDANIAIPSGCMHIEDDFTSTCSKSTETLLEEKKMLDNIKYNLFISNFFAMLVLMQTGLNLLNELKLFFNEHRNGSYSTGSFFFMKMFFEILPLLPVLCVYVYICNIYESVRPAIYWHLVLVILLNIIATQAMSYIFFVLCNFNIIHSIATGLSVYLIFILLGNLFVNLKNLHYVQQCLSYLSVPRFTVEALILLEYGFGRCAERQIQPILYWMNLTDDDYFFCIVMLICNLVFYRILAFWLLSRKVS